jgi:hypothetical protein
MLARYPSTVVTKGVTKMAGRPKGSRNRPRSPEKEAELAARRAAGKKPGRKAKPQNGASVNGKHPPGDNARTLTDDQARALHFLHVREYEGVVAALKAAAAAKKSRIGIIRAEGGSIDQIKATLELQTPEGEKRIQADIERKVTAGRWQGSRIGNLQLDMFAAEDRSPILEKAYEEGKLRGLRGDSMQTEYAGEAEQEWLRGWHAGQDALTATLDLFRSPKPDEAEVIHSGELSQGGVTGYGFDPATGREFPVTASGAEALDPNAGYSAGDGDEPSPEWMPPADDQPGVNLADVTDADFEEIEQ